VKNVLTAAICEIISPSREEKALNFETAVCLANSKLPFSETYTESSIHAKPLITESETGGNGQGS
jgi:hypothetical protein